MGASSSFLDSLKDMVYISYDISDKKNEEKYISLIHYLEQANITVITSKNIFATKLNYVDYLNNMNELVHNVPFIIVCLTNNYLKCVQQIKELNQILDREKKILYLRMDDNRILSQTDLNGLIKNNECIFLEEKIFYKIVDQVKNI